MASSSSEPIIESPREPTIEPLDKLNSAVEFLSDPRIQNEISSSKTREFLKKKGLSEREIDSAINFSKNRNSNVNVDLNSKASGGFFSSIVSLLGWTTAAVFTGQAIWPLISTYIRTPTQVESEIKEQEEDTISAVKWQQELDELKEEMNGFNKETNNRILDIRNMLDEITELIKKKDESTNNQLIDIRRDVQFASSALNTSTMTTGVQDVEIKEIRQDLKTLKHILTSREYITQSPNNSNIIEKKNSKVLKDQNLLPEWQRENFSPILPTTSSKVTSSSVDHVTYNSKEEEQNKDDQSTSNGSAQQTYDEFMKTAKR